MGGSGGHYFRDDEDPGDLVRRLRDSEIQAKDDEYEANVNQKLTEFLSDFNNRDVSGTREILDNVRKELSDEIDGTVDFVYGGSVSRHTYLEGISDTDTLVILKPDNIGHKSPEQLKYNFAQRLKDKFGDKNVKVGDLAVTVMVKGKEIQFLPAIRHGDGYKIAGPDGQSWSKINPQAFANKLTDANQTQEGKLIPTIKIVKAIIATLPNQQQLTGYHIESLAIEAFKGYTVQRVYKSMVEHFFERASELVRTPIVDHTGQSVYVDEYIGAANSTQRRLVSQALQRVYRKLQNADAAKDTKAWVEVVTGE